MRTELLPLIGQPVVAFGHLTSLKPRRRLLKRVYIYKWDQHKTAQQQPSEWHHKGQPLRGKPIVVDHIWDHVPEYYTGNAYDLAGKRRGLILYEKTYTQGFVKEYTRANGTTDLGIETAVTIFADHGDKIHELRKRGRWEDIQYLCGEVLQTDSWMFAVTKKQTPRELKRWVINCKAEAEQHLTRQFSGS